MARLEARTVYLFCVAVLSSCLFELERAHETLSQDVWHEDLFSVRSSNIQTNSTATKTDPVRRNERLTADRCDFEGRRLKVAVSPQPPLVNCVQGLFGDWMCNGSNIEVVKVLEQRFNFKAEWIVLANNHLEISRVLPSQQQQQQAAFSNDRKSAAEQSDAVSIDHQSNESRKGTQSRPNTREDFGVIGLVANGRAAFSANGVMRTSDREKSSAVLISEPFDYFQLHFMLSKTIKDHDHIFLKPFSLQAWLAILSSAALIVPTFYLINTTSSHYVMLNDSELRRLSFWFCLRHLVWRHLCKLKALVCSKRGQRKKSDDSFDALFEEMISSPQKGSSILRLEPLGEQSKRQVKFEKHKRRLVRQQWKFERKRARRLKACDKTGFFNMPYVVWYVTASLANQGGETEDLPQANSTRILVAFWWLYLIVICAIHAGILTAILTFPKQRDFVQTLDDFLNLDPSEMMRLVVDKDSELGYLLHHEEDLHKSPLETLMAHYMQTTGSPISFDDFRRHQQRVLDEVQLGRAAFIEEKSTIDHIITQEYFDTKPPRCLFKSSRFPIDIIPMAFVLSPSQMSLTCVNAINRLLSQILRSGLARKWRRKFEARGNDCLKTVVINAGDVDKIEMKHVILAFWLLMAGISVGLLFLIGEVVWLFTFGDDDDDDDGSSSTTSSWLSSSDSSSASSSSSSLATVKLGHRRAPNLNEGFYPRPIKSLQNNIAKISINRIRRHEQTKSRLLRQARQVRIPTVTFRLERDSSSNNIDLFDDTLISSADMLDKASLSKKRADEKRRRRLARAAQKRSRRLKKTLDLAKRLHDGRVYSSAVKSSVRRASQAVMRRLSIRPTTMHRPEETDLARPNSTRQDSIRRRRNRLTEGSAKVAPLVLAP